MVRVNASIANRGAGGLDAIERIGRIGNADAKQPYSAVGIQQGFAGLQV